MYGTCQFGGQNGFGAVFEVSAGGDLSAIHSFDGGEGGTETGLVVDANGILYGTTSTGGQNQNGSFFQIAPGGSLETIYSFPPGYRYLATPIPAQGGSPRGSLAIDSNGVIYGTTFDGLDGGLNSTGTVFSLAGGTPTTLYTFSAADPDTGENADGVGPFGVTLGADGNLYGVTQSGGGNDDGTIFKIPAVGGGETTLYSFDNGGSSVAPVLGSDGNLYGTGDLAAFTPMTPGSTYYRLESTLVPVITSGSHKKAKYGQPVKYQIVATNGPTKYEASDLPLGLEIDVHTGLISGVAGVVGTFPVGLSAENAEGTGYATLTITIAPSKVELPVIEVPTAPLIVKVGEPIRFLPGVSRPPFQWKAYNLPPGAHIDGKTGFILGKVDKISNAISTLEAAYQNGTSVAKLEINVTDSPDVPALTAGGVVQNANAATGKAGEVKLTLSAMSGVDVKVGYVVAGSAVPGVDYVPLSGTATIKAGEKTKKIAINPISGASNSVVELTLESGTAYTVGTPDPIKVKILAGKTASLTTPVD